ncbi:hypothetical protein NECAME_08890 [Necator americanus]|uniref:Uncharacterized protein n=1 Tax=Necator americanus TaxID=51031 RepID=W2TG76_NECAM|nr:hypothetical protein NECAME_08890 [Necator americanus]ETN80813.1 hypothetical protein NECAME_08890 [Necator americanus]
MKRCFYSEVRMSAEKHFTPMMKKHPRTTSGRNFGSSLTSVGAEFFQPDMFDAVSIGARKVAPVCVVEKLDVNRFEVKKRLEQTNDERP